MKLRFAKHPYGVPADDTRFDIGIARRLWWQFKAWVLGV